MKSNRRRETHHYRGGGGGKQRERLMREKMRDAWQWHWGNVHVWQFLQIFTKMSRRLQQPNCWQISYLSTHLPPDRERENSSCVSTRTIRDEKDDKRRERGNIRELDSLWLLYCHKHLHLQSVRLPLSQRQSSTTLAHLLCSLLSTDQQQDEEWRVISKWATQGLEFEMWMSKCDWPTETHFKAHRFHAIRRTLDISAPVVYCLYVPLQPSILMFL